MGESQPPRGGRLRRAGVANVVISGFVAVLWYFSLTMVAKRFGGSLGSDAYFFLFSLTTVFSGLITSLFGAIFLPIFIDLKVKNGMADASRFASAVLSACLMITFPLALLAFIAYIPFFRLVSKFSPAQIDEARAVLIYFAPIFVANVLAEYFRVLALVQGRYVVVAAGALLQPALLIAALLTLAGSMHEQAMALSLLAARLTLLALMIAAIARVEGLRISPRLSAAGTLRRFMRGAAPYWSANVVTSMATFAFDYVATGLGAGVLSAVSYAQKLLTLPITVVLTPILEIARTRFAEVRAQGQLAALTRLHNQLLQGTLYFTVPIAALYFTLPTEIVSSMFQRGAFGADSVVIAADCLRIYALVIPLTAVFMLNGRAMESSQRLGWTSFFGTIGNGISIIATFYLVGKLGYLGIPTARLAVELLYFLPFGFVAFSLLTGQIDLAHLPKVICVAFVAALIPCVAYRESAASAIMQNRFPSLALLVFVGAALLLIYIFIILALDQRLRFGGRLSRMLRSLGSGTS